MDNLKTKVDSVFTQLKSLNDSHATLEKSVEDCSAKVDTVSETFLHNLTEKVSKTTTDRACPEID